MKSTTQGFILITISAFFYASYGIWSRFMSQGFGEFNQAWTRGFTLLIICLGYLAITKAYKPIKSTDWKWFLWIGLAGGLNQAPYFYGFTHLPLGTAILIFYGMLVISGFVMGKWIFGEKIDHTKKVSLILGLAGMSVIYQFSLAPQQLVPALSMALAGCMGGIAGILPKKLSKNYSEAQIMVSYFIVMIIANGLASLWYQESLPLISNHVAWLSQAGYAVSMLIANVTVMMGFKRLSASVGSLVGLTEILFGVLFGIIFFSESPSFNMALGGLLIVISAILPNISKTAKN